MLPLPIQFIILVYSAFLLLVTASQTSMWHMITLRTRWNIYRNEVEVRAVYLNRVTIYMYYKLQAIHSEGVHMLRLYEFLSKIYGLSGASGMY